MKVFLWSMLTKATTHVCGAQNTMANCSISAKAILKKKVDWDEGWGVRGGHNNLIMPCDENGIKAENGTISFIEINSSCKSSVTKVLH